MVKDEGSLFINDGYSKSDKHSSRRTESSKRHRRSYNKSRLYQDEKKLFEDIFKHKNNQSLDTKIDKQFKGHLKYNLLSEDKEGDAKQCSLYENIAKKYQPALKKKIIQADNYFSAPSSTKEKNTQKLNIKQKKETKDTTKTEPVPDEATTKGDPKVASPAENQEDTGQYDIQIPKAEDIENIFQDQDTSPKDKIIHMSVIHSMDNFEELKNQENANSEPEEEPQPKNTESDKSNKAAVPILDLKILSEKKSSKAYEDPFDKESHLDLSSKRIKKLILTSDFSSLLHIREEVINKKADEEKDEIKNLLNQKKISPRTSKERTIRLEKWVIKEKEDINKTKKIIEEATKKTEDIIKDAQNNGQLLKQIMVEKITPRDNIRSGIHSERKKYEEMQKMSSSEYTKSDLNQSSQSHDRNDNSQNSSNLNDAQDATKINKEIDLTNKNLSNDIKSDSEANISVDTPLIPSDDHENSFNNAGKVVLGPQKTEGDSSEDSKEEILDSNKPISLEIKCKEDPSSDNDEPKKAEDNTAQHTLSRKKSAQRLSNIESNLNEDKSKPKSTVTPSPLNTPDFFSKGFDEMDMDDVMKNYSSTNLNQQEEEKEPEKPPPEAKEDSTPPSDYNLIKQVGTKIKKTKESRNSDIKETKNLEDEKANQYGLQDDVDFHMKKMKVSKDDIRTDQRNSSLKVSKSSGSYKEDIILDPVIDDNLEETKDPKNITGSQSLEGKETTPEKAENHSENSPKEDTLANSDSKYATVSILSEMKEKETHPHQESANKLADLIYSAMLAEIKAELFPPRPLFLLTADLDKIELEQAMIYLNDMSVEKEAELLKEFLKYSGSDDIDLSSWDDTNENDNGKTDNKMFSDSGKLVLYGRPGISTDLFSIEKYVDELADEVDAKCKSKFLTDTFTAIRHDSIKRLNQLQNSDIGCYDHFETDLNSIAILPLEVYLELEKKRKSEESNSSDSNSNNSQNYDSRKNPQETKLLKECEHIHNKALFDSINESLLQFKPYGKDGEPMPWSKKQRKLQKTPIQKDIDIKKMFEIIKHDMFRWSIMQAGTLPRQEFIFSEVFDEELFAEIREKKLATLLATEVIENEFDWLNYDFEEAQVRIDLGDMILEHLVTETISISNKIEQSPAESGSIFSKKLELVKPSDDSSKKDSKKK